MSILEVLKPNMDTTNTIHYNFTQNNSDMNSYPEYISKINELNQKAFVSDSELNTLRVCGTDSYSRMSLEELISSVSIEDADFICSNVVNDANKASALRWILRGLRPDLAARTKSSKQILLITDEQLPILDRTILEINALNQKKHRGLPISDTELKNLILRKWDFCSKLTNEEILSVINPTILTFIETHINIDRIKFEAIKWCIRGLDAELSVRRAIIKGEKTIKKARNKTIDNPNINIYQNGISQKSLYDNPHSFVILDTETTGLQVDDEIVQLSIIDLFGNTIYSSHFYPQKEVFWAAAKVNKLSKRKLLNKPLWINEWHKIAPILANKKILIHNANFDMKLINQTCKRYNIDINFKIEAFCTMNYIYKKYGHKKLEKAILASGFTPESNKLHNALYDCEMTLRCLIGQPMRNIFGIPGVPSNTTYTQFNMEPPAIPTKANSTHIDPRCINGINALNNSNHVSDEDLLNLKSFGRDIITQTKVQVIQEELGYNIVNLIKSHLHNTTDQNSAMRWCKRGLKVELAIRKQKLHMNKTV